MARLVSLALTAGLFLTPGTAYAQERSPGSVSRPLSPRNANYTIDVRLDAQAHTLSGHETLVWTNISGAATRELQFHLYYNAWRNGQSTFMKETRLAGGWRSQDDLRDDEAAAINVTNMQVTAGAIPPTDLTSLIRFIAPDDGNVDDRTVMAVSLPAEVQPNQSITLDITWQSTIPRTVFRTGVVGINIVNI